MFSSPFLSVALLLSPCLASLGPPLPESPVPPKVEPTKLDNFTWVDPFSSPKIYQFDSACESSRTFSAAEFQLHDLSVPEPQGLLPFKQRLLAVFGSRNYPGGWDGMDAHGYERNLLKMDYKDVPVQVRQWIQAQEQSGGPGKGLFAVLNKSEKDETADTKESEEPQSLLGDKIVMFAPGAIYETLPLWLAQDSGCEATLADLGKYSPKFVDGGVIGWPIEYTYPSRSTGEREMSFTLKAQVLQSPASSSEKIDQDTVKTEAKDEL